MSGIDPLNIFGRKELFGNNIWDWICFIFSILGIIYFSWAFFGLSVFWIENFFFWFITRLNIGGLKKNV